VANFSVAWESAPGLSLMQEIASKQRAAHAPAEAFFHSLPLWPLNCLRVRAPAITEVVPLPRVLIVDDEENQRRTLLIGLKLDGFEVSVASSSSEALRRLAASPPIELAMIDLMMPGLNGLELARQIRRMYPAVRVVLSSAYHLSARQVERADCGAIGFVPKPYQLDELCSFLRSKAKPTPTSPPPI
jgi:CheY-like chemotaxis protein